MNSFYEKKLCVNTTIDKNGFYFYLLRYIKPKMVINFFVTCKQP